ncbi:prohibitin family protein [Chrysiogenes arsenatis]|uniref:prohibitin family protein n=1 Tax=Chrysiogenes arsenatis TaxID=309797 RepID=UPI0003F5A7FE|nr:prohibitin family protein [Chrysiogenes arsenatis]
MNRIRAYVRQHLPQLMIASLLLVFLVVFFWPRIFVVINAGHAGILYRPLFGGTVTDRVFSEGLHIIPPWNTMHIYNMRVQEVAHEIDVLTQKGLKIHLSLSVRYHPEYDVLGVLHQKVGPDYVQKIVIPEVESTLRTIIGDFDAEEVYTTKRAILHKVVNQSLEQVTQKYIKIDDVIIRKVDLPPMIQDAIETKLEQQQIAEAYVFRLQREEQEAQRRRIEASGLKDYNDTVRESLTPQILQWKGIEATRELAKSDNAKVVVIGNSSKELPIILGSDW